MTRKAAVSLEASLVQQLDLLVARRVFPNRSQAVQEAVRDKLGTRANAYRAGMQKARSPRAQNGGRGLETGCSGMARLLRGDVVWADLDPWLGRDQSEARPHHAGRTRTVDQRS